VYTQRHIPGSREKVWRTAVQWSCRRSMPADMMLAGPQVFRSLSCHRREYARLMSVNETIGLPGCSVASPVIADAGEMDQPRPSSRRNGPVDLPSGDLRTELIDLTDASIADLRDGDETVFEPSLRRLLPQIERSRANIGSGPPGRVD
jgi:hypothetical protein